MTMDGKAQLIKPIGDKIVLEFVKRPKEQIYQDVDEDGKQTEKTQTIIVTRAVIDDFGPDYKGGLKKGDWVLFEGTNILQVDLENRKEGEISTYGICDESSIWGVYQE